MTDLLHVLTSLPTASFSNIIPSLERNHITTADLLTLDAVDVAKRAQLPAREVRRLTDAVLEALHRDLGFRDNGPDTGCESILASTGTELAAKWSTISLLDESLDSALGGGIPTGYLTEIVGESGVGKTQLLLTLLLSVQLPPSLGGLSRSAIYISTEAPLQTSRLTQMLASHPVLSFISDSDSASDSKPSLARILSIQTPDLESQEHILRYQLPIAILRHNVGLVIIDSIAANYRAELAPNKRVPNTHTPNTPTNGPAAMAKRTSQLFEVATLLRDLARTENIAVVVANQVADRFDAPPPRPLHQQPHHHTQAQDGSRATSAHASDNSPASSFGGGATTTSEGATAINDFLTLDHQQRFFTGWGDARPGRSCGTSVLSGSGYKTPSLGLVWANQIACRIALVKSSAGGNVAASSAARTLRELMTSQGDDVTVPETTSRWRRHMKVVFAPWVKGADGERGVEIVIWKGGVKGVVPAGADSG